MKKKIKDVPLGCFFTVHDMLCYKDCPTNGTDTNFCIVSEEYMGKLKFCLKRGYITNSSSLVVTIIDERFLTQLSLF